MAGRVKTGGRKKDTPNKRTTERYKALEAGGPMPLDIMLGAARHLWAKTHQGDDVDLSIFERTSSLAKDAAPYVHARLASVQHAGPGGGAIPIASVDLTNASPEQLDALEAFFGRLAGAAGGAAEDGEGGEGPAGG